MLGHNYDNKKFFSKINTLHAGDIIEITDLSSQTLSYEVTEQSEISAQDSHLVQSSENNRREITLLTCNNKNGNRVVVRAYEKAK